MRFGRYLEAARRPVPAESVAVFRICFGLLAAFSSLRFLARGWVNALYLAPEHHLGYPGFGWVHPWPAPWMHLHMAALAALGLCMALGWHTRLAAWLFTAGFAYTELIDAALYLNHYWYMTLAGVLVALLPVGNRWSLDTRTGRVDASPTVQAAVVWMLRFQLAVVYAFAGLAKLNGDWLWRAQPLRLWLADRTELPVVGSLLDEPVTAYLASWSGVAFDCTIVGWLLWRRTRPWAFVVLMGFHAMTGWLFPAIGVFPWVMTLGALVFFRPDWPSRLAAAITRTLQRSLTPGSGRCTQRPAAAAITRTLQRSLTLPAPAKAASTPQLRPAAVAALLLLAVVQVLLPLRHHVYPGDVRWTEQGYYLSWRVMLTEKTGYTQFRVTDPGTGRSWLANPDLVLTDWQTEQAAINPGLIRSTARLVADHYREAGITNPRVQVDAWVSINGRQAQRIVDPGVDLAARQHFPATSDWILPSY